MVDSTSQTPADEAREQSKKSSKRKTVLVGVQCSQDMIDRIQRFSDTLDFPDMSRPEVIRVIIHRYLKGLGV